MCVKLKKERGYILIEILLAFLLLAIITGPLLNLLYGTRQNYEVAACHTTAFYLAREKMERVITAGYDCAADEYEGAVDGFEEFSRRVIVMKPEEGISLKQITVEVTWQVQGRHSSYELVSFVAGR